MLRQFGWLLLVLLGIIGIQPFQCLVIFESQYKIFIGA